MIVPDALEDVVTRLWVGARPGGKCFLRSRDRRVRGPHRPANRPTTSFVFDGLMSSVMLAPSKAPPIRFLLTVCATVALQYLDFKFNLLWR
jgi:hypothetical protein